MGITFQEYVKRLRIDRAKWLLMTEKLPVMEVCYQSGFRDIKTFNKVVQERVWDESYGISEKSVA